MTTTIDKPTGVECEKDVQIECVNNHMIDMCSKSTIKYLYDRYKLGKDYITEVMVDNLKNTCSDMSTRRYLHNSTDKMSFEFNYSNEYIARIIVVYSHSYNDYRIAKFQFFDELGDRIGVNQFMSI